MTTPQPQRPGLLKGALVLLGGSVALLPAWDALSHPARVVLAIVAGGAAVAAVALTRQIVRWALYVGSLLFIVIYSAISGGAHLLERSRETDRLPRCTASAPITTPCLSKSEDRSEHHASSPDGDMEDGFRQVILRYPTDQHRLILGPMIALFFAAFGGILLQKADPGEAP